MNPGSNNPQRIAVVGPESSGKTTLSKALAERLGVPWVAEYAREYLEAGDGTYTEADLEIIARGQKEREDAAAAREQRAIICDTNLLVVAIWGEVKYGRCPDWVKEGHDPHGYTLHLLTAPDVGWEADPLREAPDESVRWELMGRYQRALEAAGVPYEVVRGTGEQRFAGALAAVTRTLG